MEIHLPDHPQIAAKASAAGFANVEEYVRHLIEADAGPLPTPAQGDVFEANGQTFEDWQHRFEKLLASLEPGNPNFDDSRESIYPVR